MKEKPHVLRVYDEVLGQLRADVERICRITVRNLDAVTQGVRDNQVEPCLRAIADDEEVNALEKAIDARGIEILTRFQPVAGDLRFVMAAMRVATNLERVSDEAKSIARRSRMLIEGGFRWEPGRLATLFGMAGAELAAALRAFLEGDMAAAHGVRPQDKALDASHKECIARISAEMAARPEATTYFVALLLIVRSLERIGDHAKNIAEESIFLNEARDVRYPKSRLPVDGATPADGTA